MSPRPGISILITSAPIHANNWVAVGPAWTCPKSRTRTPSSALLIHCLQLSSRPAPGLPGMTSDSKSREVSDIVTHRVEEVAVPLDMRRKPQRVLARQPLGEFGITAFDRRDDLHMIDDRARRPVFLMDRDLADRTHMDKQICGHF